MRAKSVGSKRPELEKGATDSALSSIDSLSNEHNDMLHGQAFHIDIIKSIGVCCVAIRV